MKANKIKNLGPDQSHYRLTIQSTKFQSPFSRLNSIVIIFICHISFSISSLLPIPPPIPILPLPSSQQLSWQLSDMALFLHFGPNTFTDTEWGSGHADPSVFAPTGLNATQWISVAKENGFSRVILTAKHHDGFCLWPSDYTDYSVKSSPWKNGNGDVVGELAEAAVKAGIQLGLYLSPWDRHEPVYGKTLEYNEYYMGQMTELLTRYGVIKEVWLDGAKGEGGKDMEYYFDDWFSLIHQLQPGAVIFSDTGPDTRWVGDEAGFAGTTCWSLFNRSAATIGGTDTKYSQEGDPLGHDWVPAECDVSIRPGWFWHASQVPKSSLISDEDIQVLREFSDHRSFIFSHNLAENALLSASNTRGGLNDSRFASHNILQDGIYNYWAPVKDQSNWVLYLDFSDLVKFNVLLVQEPIHMGQRIIEFHLDILNGKGEWQEVTQGTTVGYRRLLLFPPVETQHLRFVIDRSRADPLISYLGIYTDPFSNFSNVPATNMITRLYFKVQFLRKLCTKIFKWPSI